MHFLLFSPFIVVCRMPFAWPKKVVCLLFLIGGHVHLYLLVFLSFLLFCTQFFFNFHFLSCSLSDFLVVVAVVLFSALQNSTTKIRKRHMLDYFIVRALTSKTYKILFSSIDDLRNLLVVYIVHISIFIRVLGYFSLDQSIDKLDEHLTHQNGIK